MKDVIALRAWGSEKLIRRTWSYLLLLAEPGIFDTDSGAGGGYRAKEANLNLVGCRVATLEACIHLYSEDV